MKFKAKVKRLNVGINNETTDMKVWFESFDKTTICNEQHYWGIDENTQHVIKINEVIDYTISNKDMFDFISQHSKETFIVTEDNKQIKEVELIYG